MIFDRPRSPCLPIQRATKSAFQNAIATKPRLTKRERSVNTKPTVSTRINSAVSNAGPAINGIPSGTTPKSLLASRSAGARFSNSRPASPSRIRPPATWKSATVIPSATKIIFPRNMNPTAIQSAVKIPTNPWRCRSSRETLPAKPIKTATSPIGSMATKIGMKATKNLWIIRGARFR